MSIHESTIVTVFGGQRPRLNVLRVLSWIMATAVLFFIWQGTCQADADEKLEQITIDESDLKLVIGNHMPHGGGKLPNYEGIHHLSHRLRPQNVFRPIYAGMIGVRRFCHVVPVGRTGASVVSGSGANRKTETFVVTPPHYVDYSVTFTPAGTVAYWNNTCYMNDLSTPAVHIRQPNGTWAKHYSEKHGHQASVAPVTMDPLPPVTKVANPKYPHGTNHFHQGFSDLRFDPKFPVMYGRIENMAFIYMAEPRLGDSFIPYMSPTGGGGPKNPAWDFRYRLRNLTPGKPMTIRIRLCYKPWVDEDDVTGEYEKWRKQYAEVKKR